MESYRILKKKSKSNTNTNTNPKTKYSINISEIRKIKVIRQNTNYQTIKNIVTNYSNYQNIRLPDTMAKTKYQSHLFKLGDPS